MISPTSHEYDILEEEYNRFPYESYPFFQSHPTHLYTLAKLFGLNPKPVEKSKILELGCASGGNLIPMAYHFPKAKFIGIDLSDKQIQEGKKNIDDLQIENINLRHQSILDFNEREGKFDYIICHGVYSWVEKKVREKIFKICQENLEENGIVYISYNTFPGWNMVNSVRDLMMWHTKSINDPAQKAKHARQILKFITDGLEGIQTPYADFLKSEIKLLMNHADSYLLHDHLSSYNDPTYFYQFMEEANKYELTYLSDAFPSTMLAENFLPVFANELKKINNIIVMGQYMDFIRNQRFRCTLLCHKNQNIMRALKTSDIETFYVQFTGRCEKENLTKDDIESNQPLNFSNANTTLKISNPLSKWAMLILMEERLHMIHYNELCEKVAARSQTNELEKIKHAINEDLNLMRGALAGLISISAYPSNYILTINEKPMACPLARYQSSHQRFITNRKHQAIKLDAAGLFLLPFLDGEHTITSLEKVLLEGIKEGKLTMLDKDNQPIRNEETLKKFIPSFCQKLLENFATQALLISPL